MNSTIRNLVIAAPLATAALTMVPTAATAVEPGPTDLIVQPHTDPQPPKDKVAPAPKPTQPKDKLAPAPKPTQPKGPQDLSDKPKPKGPGDIANPEPEPTHPQGPGDLTSPEPCPTHGVDCTPGDEPKTSSEPKGGSGGARGTSPRTVEPVVETVQLPTRIDAGQVAEEQDQGLDLAWYIAGGLAVTATGAAFAVRRRTRAND